VTKVIVVYESKYGNTKLVAEKIVEAIKEVEEMETAPSELKEVDLNKIPSYDAILIGSPNHFGGPTRDIKICRQTWKASLKGKNVCGF
jgi:flavodoxin